MRRRLLILVACLSAGAALSVATAWGAILWRVFVAKPYLGANEGGPESGPWPLVPPEGWPEPDSRQVTRAWGYERIVANGAAVETPDGLRGGREFRLQAERDLRTLVEDLERTMRDSRSLPADERAALLEQFDARAQQFRLQPLMSHSLMTFRRRSGWPVLCMESSWVDHSRAGARSAAVDPLGRGWTMRMCWERGIPWPQAVNSNHFNLPLRPVPWLFVANTGAWALVAWFALRGIWIARRRLRRLRGLCPTCRYPLGVAPVCTECGRPPCSPSPGGSPAEQRVVRAASIVAAFLLCGAALNVAIAWTCAALGNAPMTVVREGLLRAREGEAEILWSDNAPPSDDPLIEAIAEDWRDQRYGEAVVTLSSGRALGLRTAAVSGSVRQHAMLLQHRCGWPWLAFACTASAPSPPLINPSPGPAAALLAVPVGMRAPSWDSAVDIPAAVGSWISPQQSPIGPYDRPLPGRIIWRGAAANSFVLGLLAFVLYSLPAWARITGKRLWTIHWSTRSASGK